MVDLTTLDPKIKLDIRYAMEAEGFTVNEVEWWHFDYKDWNRYAIGNIPFKLIGNQ